MGLFRKLSLEGSLAIFNVLSLLAFVVLARSIDGAMWLRPFETAVTVWLWVLSLPIALFCFVLVSQGGGSGIEIVILCAAAGINAIVWGHGLAWLLRKTLLAGFVSAANDVNETDGESDEDLPPTPPSG